MSYKSTAEQKEYQKRWDRARRQAVQEYIRQLKARPCMDCNISYPHWIMEFDHARGQKKFTIGNVGSGSMSRKILDEEIAKCDIICANCHNDRTWRREHLAGH